jgi:integrase
MPKKYKYTSSFTYEGRRYYIHADTKADLAVRKAMKLRDLEEGKVTITGNTTVETWALECVRTYKTNQKEITHKKYLSRLKHCILEQIGSMRLRDVKPLHCQNVLNLQRGKSKTQINEVYSMLQLIFKKAVANNLILSNPAENTEKPLGTHKSRRSITEAERTHIMKVAKADRRYYLYLLMLQCSCRPSEAAEAMGKDIILMDGIPMLHIRATKNDYSDRFVPIPDDLYQLIKKTPKNEYIAQYSTGKKIDDANRHRLWTYFKRDLNISMGCKMRRNKLIPPYPVAPDLVPYCLRHTYCTDLARMEIDIRIAQKLMGHSDISLTANIYTNLMDEDIVKIAKKHFGCTQGATVKSRNIPK